MSVRVSGAVDDGMIPGYYCLETGSSYSDVPRPCQYALRHNRLGHVLPRSFRPGKDGCFISVSTLLSYLVAKWHRSAGIDSSIHDISLAGSRNGDSG